MDVGRRRGVLLGAALALAVVTVAGAVLFQPWRLWTVRTADEAAPALAGAPAASGGLRSLAHGTTGTVTLGRDADGRLLLRLEDLSTSDGPDLRVWLSAATGEAVRDAAGSPYVDLGALRANRGSLTYVVPAGTDPGDYASVVIWCRRFSVAFGAADLAAPGAG